MTIEAKAIALLRTKMQQPRLPADLILRRRLLDQLHARSSWERTLAVLALLSILLLAGPLPAIHANGAQARQAEEAQSEQPSPLEPEQVRFEHISTGDGLSEGQGKVDDRCPNGRLCPGGTSYGMAEETLAFYALVVTVMIAAGYDALTGVAIIMLGAGVGVLASTVNPFATGIASGFAGISVAEGLVGRLVILVVGTIIGIVFVTRYAERVRKDPLKSVVYDQKAENEAFFLKAKGQGEYPEFTGRRRVILALFGLAFLVMVYGVIPWQDIGIPFPQLDWWFGELTALFLLFAIIIGLIGRLGEENLGSTFVDGARDMLGVALIVGLARGISVVMNNGLITDTVLYWAERALSGLGGVAFINVTHLLYLPLSFLNPSSSGLATVSMPIMAPLGDLAGVDRALIVTAYQSANGLINLITPTSAVVMGGLALGRVDFAKWLRFVLPVVIILLVLYAVVLSIGILI